MAGLGPFIMVVGPSGAGKDALLAGAAAALAPTGRFHFARRTVTRPAEAGGENHLSVALADFEATEAEGEFLLSWRAHGLCYGIPREPATRLRETGQAVVANVSRTVVEAARARLQPIAIVAVTAPEAVLAKRLKARGREDANAIEARLKRANEIEIAGRDVTVVMNDGALADGVAAMVAALEAASSPEWEPAE